MKTIKFILTTLFVLFTSTEATKVKTQLKKEKCKKSNLKCNCDY